MRKALGLGLLLAAVSAQAWATDNRLAQAVRDNDLKAVKSLLAAHADPNALLPDRSTVLAWAVDRQNEEMVRLLLAAGALPRALSPGAVQPLALACELGDAAI